MALGVAEDRDAPLVDLLAAVEDVEHHHKVHALAIPTAREPRTLNLILPFQATAETAVGTGAQCSSAGRAGAAQPRTPCRSLGANAAPVQVRIAHSAEPEPERVSAHVDRVRADEASEQGLRVGFEVRKIPAVTACVSCTLCAGCCVCKTTP